MNQSETQTEKKSGKPTSTAMMPLHEQVAAGPGVQGGHAAVGGHLPRPAAAKRIALQQDHLVQIGPDGQKAGTR